MLNFVSDFFVRTKILLIFISFSSRLDFRFSFSLVNENLKHFVIFVIVVVD